jgi:hypothetical protein
MGCPHGHENLACIDCAHARGRNEGIEAAAKWMRENLSTIGGPFLAREMAEALAAPPREAACRHGNTEVCGLCPLPPVLPVAPPAAPVEAGGEACAPLPHADPYRAFDRTCSACGETWRGVHECPAAPRFPTKARP